jgi:hypothetical protein
MADEATIDRFRRMTDLSDTDEVYTDAVIDGMIEDLGFNAAVAAVWTEKAASAAGLVDTTESGSSRKLSDLHKQYLAMADAANPGADAGSAAASYTVEVERV